MLIISGKVNKVSKIIDLLKKYDNVLLVTKDKYGLALKDIVKVIKFNNIDSMWNKINSDSYYKDLFKQFDLIVFHMFSSEYELEEYKKLESSIEKNIAVMIQSNKYCEIYNI